MHKEQPNKTMMEYFKELIECKYFRLEKEEEEVLTLQDQEEIKRRIAGAKLKQQEQALRNEQQGEF
jgi:hypothetical protein